MVGCLYQRETSGDMEQSRSLVGGRLLLFFIGQVFKNDHSYQPTYRCSLLACQRPKFIHRFGREEHIRSLAVALWPRRHSARLLCVYYITILSPFQGLIILLSLLYWYLFLHADHQGHTQSMGRVGLPLRNNSARRLRLFLHL